MPNVEVTAEDREVVFKIRNLDKDEDAEAWARWVATGVSGKLPISTEWLDELAEAVAAARPILRLQELQKCGDILAHVSMPSEAVQEALGQVLRAVAEIVPVAKPLSDLDAAYELVAADLVAKRVVAVRLRYIASADMTRRMHVGYQALFHYEDPAIATKRSGEPTTRLQDAVSQE